MAETKGRVDRVLFSLGRNGGRSTPATFPLATAKQPPEHAMNGLFRNSSKRAI
jgi:hypothetical protein